MNHPPYHLRLNKAVDRFMLIEIVRQLGTFLNLHKYTYYGFGGPFLEDFRLFNEYCPEVNLVSIEANEQTYFRQKFHKFSRKLHLINENFGNFLSAFESFGEEIFWIDYTDISLARFDDFERLLKKASPGTVVKVTLCMKFAHNPYQDKCGCAIAEEEFDKKLLGFQEEFEQEFSGILPSSFSSKRLRPGELPNLIQDMIQISAEKALPASCGNIFQLLQSAYYSDGTPMISVTGIVSKIDDVIKVKQCLNGCNGTNFNWSRPQEIDVPVLSVKERLLLEGFLPVQSNTGKCLSKALGYKIEKTQSKNLQKLRQFAEFYRYYPVFSKISI